jgi:hypothetical protein
MGSILRETVFSSDAYVWEGVQESARNCFTSHASGARSTDLNGKGNFSGCVYIPQHFQKYRLN